MVKDICRFWIFCCIIIRFVVKFVIILRFASCMDENLADISLNSEIYIFTTLGFWAIRFYVFMRNNYWSVWINESQVSWHTFIWLSCSVLVYFIDLGEVVTEMEFGWTVQFGCYAAEIVMGYWVLSSSSQYSVELTEWEDGLIASIFV